MIMTMDTWISMTKNPRPDKDVNYEAFEMVRIELQQAFARRTRKAIRREA